MKGHTLLAYSTCIGVGYSIGEGVAEVHYLFVYVIPFFPLPKLGVVKRSIGREMGIEASKKRAARQEPIKGMSVNVSLACAHPWLLAHVVVGGSSLAFMG